MLTPHNEAAFQHFVELKERERSECTSSKEECVNMSSCVRPMRGAMTEVGGVMGVMAGDGPSESRMSLSGLSSETSSVASVEGQRDRLPGGGPTFLWYRSLKRSMLIIKPCGLSKSSRLQGFCPKRPSHLHGCCYRRKTKDIPTKLDSFVKACKLDRARLPANRSSGSSSNSDSCLGPLVLELRSSASRLAGPDWEDANDKALWKGKDWMRL